MNPSPSDNKKVNGVLKTSSKSSGGTPNKRVKFSRTIEQVDFLKQTPISSSEDEGEEAEKEDNSESEGEESDDQMEESKTTNGEEPKVGHLGWQSS